MKGNRLQAPFPWFGGKRKVADVVWRWFGSVVNYVEPFYGSGAVLLGRPEPFAGVETINDADGYVANFWRAILHNPDETAYWANNPVNENDLHARHSWLVQKKEEFIPRLEGDPSFYDTKIAGWWVWGICNWIGSGFCSGDGSWIVEDDMLCKLPHLGDKGRGIQRKLPHLGNGQGIQRKLPHLGDKGQGILDWFRRLAARLESVRVCCGDWTRVCGPSVTFKHGITGVFLDPPYGDATGRCPNLYRVDSGNIPDDIRVWCAENGSNQNMRIALCGYEGEYELPGWEIYEWNAGEGFGGQASSRSKNGRREQRWFSPACLRGGQQDLFEEYDPDTQFLCKGGGDGPDRYKNY